MTSWACTFECIAVPCLIGLLMYFLFNAWDRRRRGRAKDTLPGVDYII